MSSKASSPPHEPAEDAIAFAGRAALSLIPAVGPLASKSLAYALEARQAQRQYDFNVQIARALTETMQRLDASATLEDVVSSEDFIAGFTRAQRAAAETASSSKRRPLAAAAANGRGGRFSLRVSERSSSASSKTSTSCTCGCSTTSRTPRSTSRTPRSGFRPAACTRRIPGFLRRHRWPARCGTWHATERVAGISHSSCRGPRPCRACLHPADYNDEPERDLPVPHLAKGSTLPRVH